MTRSKTAADAASQTASDLPAEVLDCSPAGSFDKAEDRTGGAAVGWCVTGSSIAAGEKKVSGGSPAGVNVPFGTVPFGSRTTGATRRYPALGTVSITNSL